MTDISISHKGGGPHTAGTAEGGGEGECAGYLTDLTTGESFTAQSSLLGYYPFQEIVVGRTYLLSVSSKRYTFR
jgi:hypothetical protein